MLQVQELGAYVNCNLIVVVTERPLKSQLPRYIRFYVLFTLKLDELGVQRFSLYHFNLFALH